MTQQIMFHGAVNQDTSTLSAPSGFIYDLPPTFLRSDDVEGATDGEVVKVFKVDAKQWEYLQKTAPNDVIVKILGIASTTPSEPSADVDVRGPLTSLQSEDEFAKKLMLSRGLLKDAIAEGLEAGCGEPTPQAMMGAYDMLGIVDKAPQGHDVKTFVTEDQDVVTDVTDSESNYVMLVNRADGTVAVHFNIRSYQEYDKQGDVSDEFVETLLKSLKRREPAT